MRRYLVILFLLFAFSKLQAQTNPSPADSAMHVKFLSDSMAMKAVKLSEKIQTKIDSAKTALDSIFHARFSVIDSVEARSTALTNRIDSLRRSLNDSIGSVISKYSGRLTGNKFVSSIDSLKNTTLPHARYLNKADSLQSLDPLRSVKNKIGSQQSKIQKYGDGAAGQINENMNVLSKESLGHGNLPQNISAPNAELPLGNLDLPKTALPDTDLDVNLNPDLPEMEVPALEIPNNPLEGKIDSSLPSVPTDVPDLNDMNEVTNLSGELSGVSDKVTEYSTDIEAIKSGDLDDVQSVEKDIVSGLPIEKEIAVLQEQQDLLDKHEAEVKSFKNPEEYKKQTLARARKVIAQHLSIYGNELKQSMGKVSSYQNKMGTLLNKRGDLPKRRDPLRKLKTFEKFVPGVTIQIQKPGGAWLVDVNPSVRYRLTSYWSVGSGWNERVLVGKYSQSREECRVFGMRSFTEVIIYKGITARLEAEDMNAFIHWDIPSRSAGQRVWIWSYMAGIKKEFTFFPKITGNVQFMYNVYSSNRFNPYPTKFNVRFGFERTLKRKVKK
ncbi:MAG: hypothetical protein WD824_24655 [Cyclobacteriaceae bacterium]